MYCVGVFDGGFASSVAVRGWKTNESSCESNSTSEHGKEKENLGKISNRKVLRKAELRDQETSEVDSCAKKVFHLTRS